MMLSRLRNPLLALMVILQLLTFLTAPATAGMVGALASNPDGGKIKGEDLGRIQRALETQIVKSHLEAYGLTAEETRERLRDLSDEQIHLLAQASDRVLAGGDGRYIESPGTIIVIGTDGIWETHNGSGEMFGKQRVLEVIGRNAEKPAREIQDSVLEAVSEFRGDERQQDDITVAVVKLI